MVSKRPGNFVFQVNPGLDGKADTESLESISRKGCFVYSGVTLNAGTILKLSCTVAEAGFKQAASFIMQKGMNQCNPLSFVAKGTNRNCLLAPLMIFRDETDTVCFNISPKGIVDRIIESVVIFFIVLDIFFEFRLVNFVNAVLRTGH